MGYNNNGFDSYGGQQNQTYDYGAYASTGFEVGAAAYNQYQPSPQDMYNAAKTTH
jgi:hypothetical protein